MVSCGDGTKGSGDSVKCHGCQKPSCLECFPFERPSNPPTPDDPYQTVLDVAPNAAGEDEPVIYSEAEHLADVRKFNADNKVMAPTRHTVADILQDHTLETPFPILDFTGEIDGGGVKNSMYDDYVNKPPMELVPRALTKACARALGYGAAKYAPNNWRRGMRWGEVFGGLKRHLDAWNEGEDIDAKEDGGSGLNHLDHAAACLAFLCHMVSDERYKKMDDRP